MSVAMRNFMRSATFGPSRRAGSICAIGSFRSGSISVLNDASAERFVLRGHEITPLFGRSRAHPRRSSSATCVSPRLLSLPIRRNSSRDAFHDPGTRTPLRPARQVWSPSVLRKEDFRFMTGRCTIRTAIATGGDCGTWPLRARRLRTEP